ncbi:hypothetical protein SASPL_136282 [Salvia splendens]|uniref:WRKY domain-containing protein n=1 Tax=Salvia splendens TaxID=180675 RepID=A0A8X8WZK6_SALSN|nr:WRKY transcription factor 72A-like [Salvia splendens]KAG6404046.1 hypothetical protein SASPL_136282 [Salvia splendens]
MDISLRKSSLEEKSKPSDEESCVKVFDLHQGLVVTNMERPSPESESRSSSSAKKEQLHDQLGSAKAEMDEVMEENQRLKTHLDRILKDYRTLQMQYRDVEAAKSPHQSYHDLTAAAAADHELIDLSLAMCSTDKKGESTKIRDDKQGLPLGLDCKFDLPEKSPVTINLTPENSVEEVKEEAGETWPNKGVKNGRDGGGEDEISLQNPTKRARVSVRVRCDTPTMNDGCQWRKYGQKISKGNPCPRAYYRCTVAPSCPVRKQVQRCVEDMSILTTTYEGTHNHPLPASATAMASTTSAAASMLMSGSSTSGTEPSSSSTTTANLHGLNFYLSDNSRAKPAFYLPNPSISSSPSYPTITLDLTSSSSSSSSHLNRLGSGSFVPRYSTTNLNFRSLESNPLPISYNNSMLTHGQQSFNRNQNVPSLSFGSQPYETLYQSYLQKTQSNPNPNQLHLGPDTIAAATKAITSDPSFQNVLAAALTSIIGGSGGGATANHNAVEKSSAFPILSSFPPASNANKCAPSFMNKSSSSTSSQQPGLSLLSPPFPFSSSNKSKSNSPADNRDHV